MAVSAAVCAGETWFVRKNHYTWKAVEYVNSLGNAIHKKENYGKTNDEMFGRKRTDRIQTM
jgi:hypothetical protein